MSGMMTKENELDSEGLLSDFFLELFCGRFFTVSPFDTLDCSPYPISIPTSTTAAIVVSRRCFIVILLAKGFRDSRIIVNQ